MDLLFRFHLQVSGWYKRLSGAPSFPSGIAGITVSFRRAAGETVRFQRTGLEDCCHGDGRSGGECCQTRDLSSAPARRGERFGCCPSGVPPLPPSPAPPQSYRAFGVDQQQVFGESVVHSRQHVRPGVGGALADQEVPVVPQQFLRLAAAHDAVVPRLALQLLLRPEGQGAHQEGAGVVHRRRLVKASGLGMLRSLGLNGVLKGLWCK